MIETTEGQLYNVPGVGFDQAISPKEYDPLSRNEAQEEVLSDHELENRIQWLFRESPLVNADGVRVHVEDHNAILSGDVEDRHAMIVAVEIAYDAGATHVSNRLRLKEQTRQPRIRLTDRQLKEAVENELYWSPFVDSVPIQVQVQNGVVTLSGRVDDQGEIAAAVENAYEAGAQTVFDRLWIDPQ